MKSLKHLVLVLAGVVMFIACQKEYSLETGNTAGFASGSLKDTLGNCQGITINGNYEQDSTLTDSNYIYVQANITSPGVYSISTDVNNGFYFKDSGYVSTLGLVTFKLKGYGTPLANTSTEFTVKFGVSFCLFVIDVTGTGGSGTPATYTLAGAPSACTGATVQGTYQTGTPLTTANTATIQVNVTTPGNFAISTTTTDGITFSRSGTFTNAGVQQVVLQAAGVPTAAGNFTIPVTAGNSSCSFPLTVATGTGSGIIYSDYFPTTTGSNWTYQESSTGDTVRVTATGSTATFAGNTYTIFTNSADTTKGFYRKAAGWYYEYSDLDDLGFFDTVYNKVETVFLKENVAVNTTWESPEVNAVVSGQPAKAKIKYTLIGKNIQKTVGSVALDSVMNVKREYMLQATGLPYQTLVAANFYYAKNIGFVFADASAIGSTITATRWEIK